MLAMVLEQAQKTGRHRGSENGGETGRENGSENGLENGSVEGDGEGAARRSILVEKFFKIFSKIVRVPYPALPLALTP